MVKIIEMPTPDITDPMWHEPPTSFTPHPVIKKQPSEKSPPIDVTDVPGAGSDKPLEGEDNAPKAQP